jgi:hypothetical protein
MIFEPGPSLSQARQLVQERLTQAAVAMPSIATPPAMLEPTSLAACTMVIGMSARDQSLIDESVLARWTIRPKPLGVPGVANVHRCPVVPAPRVGAPLTDADRRRSQTQADFWNPTGSSGGRRAGRANAAAFAARPPEVGAAAGAAACSTR